MEEMTDLEKTEFVEQAKKNTVEALSAISECEHIIDMLKHRKVELENTVYDYREIIKTFS